MKCRKVIKNGDHYDIVWFGSTGLKTEPKEDKGKGVFWQEDKSSYAESQEGLASSLIQRLSVIKGELWYKINYGLPVFNKVKDKDIMDSVIIDIILSHPDVRSIKSMASIVENNIYKIKNLVVISVFNEEISLY